MNVLIWIITIVYVIVVMGLFSYGSYRVIRTKRKRCPSGSLPLTVIKPIKGADEQYDRYIRSWLVQDYAGPVQYIFSFQDEDDEGIAIVKRLISSFPDKDIMIIINPIRDQWSGKASNLYYGLEKANYDYIVFSDSDTIAHKNVLSQLMEPFIKNENVGAVTSFVNSTEARSIAAMIVGSAMNAIFISLWALLPFNVKVGVAGGSVALQKSTLNRIGGIAAFAPFVADDLKLGHLISQMGLDIEPGPYIESPVGKFSLLEGFNRLHRGQLAMRHMVPTGQYLLFTFANMIYIPSAIWGMFSQSATLMWTSLIMFLIKCLASTISNIVLKNPWYSSFLVPLFDFVSIITTFSSFLYSRLSWRGVTYIVDGEGRLKEKKAKEPSQVMDEYTMKS